MSINLVRKGLGIWTALSALVLSGILVTGCHSHPPAGRAAPANPQPLLGSQNPDVIYAGQTLMIFFTDVPDKLQAFEEKVKEEGTITLMQNLTFVVTNKTTGELEREIRSRYVPDYYPHMTVTVKHQDQTRFYYVGGEVRSPGRQVYISSITVTKAIQTAGDFTDFAKKTKVRLTSQDGKVQIVDCKKAIIDPRLDPQVYPGDKIHVPRRIW